MGRRKFSTRLGHITDRVAPSDRGYDVVQIASQEYYIVVVAVAGKRARASVRTKVSAGPWPGHHQTRLANSGDEEKVASMLHRWL